MKQSLHRVGRLTWCIALMVAACTPGKPKVRMSRDPSEIRLQINADPVSLDPSLAEDGLSGRILNNTMDGLVGYDSDGKLQNRLAESYRISSDGKRMEFKIRTGAQWSDGTPVRAQDFVTALRRSFSPKTISKNAQVFSAIRGFDDFRSGKNTDLGVYEKDQKLVIELSRPAPYVIQALSMSAALPQREDILNKNDGKWPSTAPVTGPYQLETYRVSQDILLVPNLKHWKGPPAEGMKKIRLLIISDESTALSLFEQGGLDVLSRVPSFDLERLKKQGWVHVSPFFATFFVAFNTQKAPFDSRNWRRAVSSTVQRAEMVAALGTGEIPASSWIPHGVEGTLPLNEDPKRFEDSVIKVKGQIAQGKGSLVVELQFDTGSRNALLMEKFQQDVIQGLGLQVHLQNMDWKSHIQKLGADAPQMYRFGWQVPFHDPIVMLQAYTTDNPNNYSHFSNPEYDRLVEEISRMSAGGPRTRKIEEANRILTEREAVIIPIYHYVQIHAVRPDILGFKVNPFGVIFFSPLRRTSS